MGCGLGKSRFEFTKCLLFGALVVLSLAPAAALASDGRVPVYDTTPISAPGSYYLTREVTGTVSITSSDVFLDLNGFTVNPNVNIMAAGNLDRVRVANGKVVNALFATRVSGLIVNDLHVGGGFDLVDCTKAIVERCTTESITLRACLSSRVAGCTLSNGSGIRLAPSVLGTSFCKDVEVADNTVMASTSQGVSIEAASGCSVVRNVIQGSTQYGISMIPQSPAGPFATGNRVAENTISGCTLGGIQMNQSYVNQITLNVVTGNGVDAPGSSGGIYLSNSSGNEISHNSVSGNGGAGITLSTNAAYNNLLYNTVTSNGTTGANAGILVSGNQNSIDWNACHFNTNFGINVQGSGNVLSHNRALGNTAGSYLVNPGNTLVHYSMDSVGTIYPTNF